MTQQIEPTQSMWTRAMANMQRELILERMRRTALEAEIERLTQVCSQQAQELLALRVG